MSFRTATTTVDTSGATLFQSAWVDENGRISGFVPDESKSKVEKYFNSNTLEVLYKLFPMASEEMFLVTGTPYTYRLWKSDISGLNWQEILIDLENPEIQFYEWSSVMPIKLGDNYVIVDGDLYIYTSTDLSNWIYRDSSDEYDDATRLKFIKLSETQAVIYNNTLSYYKYTLDAGLTWSAQVDLGDYYVYDTKELFNYQGTLCYFKSDANFGEDPYVTFSQKSSISGASWDTTYTAAREYYAYSRNIFTVGDKIIFTFKEDAAGGYASKIATLSGAPAANGWTHEDLFTSPSENYMDQVLVDQSDTYTTQCISGSYPYTRIFYSSSTTPSISGASTNVMFKNTRNNKYYIKNSDKLLEAPTAEGPWTEKTVNIPLEEAWIK